MNNDYHRSDMEKSCAIIFGGGFNGYITTRELYESGVKNIILVDPDFDTSRFWKTQLTNNN